MEKEDQPELWEALKQSLKQFHFIKEKCVIGALVNSFQTRSTWASAVWVPPIEYARVVPEKSSPIPCFIYEERRAKIIQELTCPELG